MLARVLPEAPTARISVARRAGRGEGILYPYISGSHGFFLLTWNNVYGALVFSALVAVDFLAMGMRGSSGQFNPSDLGNVAVSLPIQERYPWQ